MKPRLLSRGVLLALVLVIGQWLSFEHASRHPALSPVDQTCDFCLQAQGSGAGLVDVPKAATPTLRHEVPEPRQVAFFVAAAPSYYPIRGPPRRHHG